MELFVYLMIFILGLAVGSFVNMLTYRMAIKYRLLRRRAPRNDVLGRSFCDFCGQQLRWYENIPVISWLIQKGKTRCCHKKLPTEYPLVELGMGVIFLLVWALGLAPLQIGLGWTISALLVFAMIFDLKYMILPDVSTYLLIGLALVGVVFDEPNIIPYLLSAAGAFGLLGLLYVITKGKGMGFGDVKLAIFMGLFLGWPKIVVAFYVAFITGAVISLILLWLKKVKLKSAIPFGPWLILGTVVAWGWGERIIKLLISNI